MDCFFGLRYNSFLSYDGVLGAQSVDLFDAYLGEFWGVSDPLSEYNVRYAYQIFDYNPPSGWMKISGAIQYRVGDVVIWNQSDSSRYGTVGIIYSVDGDSVVTCEQNFNRKQYVTMQKLHNAGAILGVFRPPLTEDPDTPDVDVNALAQAIADAEKIEKNKDDYTEASVAALVKELSAGRAALESGDQQTIDRTAAAIEKAINNMKKKPEKTDQPETPDQPSSPDQPAVPDQPVKPDAFRFDDVKNEKTFYYAPVYWAYNAIPQITNGVDKTHFGPENGCTRGQVVTFLWRAAGCPKPKRTKTAFIDVSEKSFYAEAVAWAVENEITKGMSRTAFVPDATCTRGQIVTFLCRFRHSPAATSKKTKFTDVGKGAFYTAAVAWAVENDVTKGMTDTTFAPDATCTRGQIVTFLYRAMNE